MSKQNENEFNKNFSSTKSKPQNKIWKMEYPPLRKIILWGRDKDNNPGFLFLYGDHNFQQDKKSYNYILDDFVNYTDYAIFSGKQGHLPSFESVKIMSGYNYEKKKNVNEMYYKVGIINWWDKDEHYLFDEYAHLDSKSISIPYFTEMSYKECVDIVKKSGIDFKGFKITENPNEILNIDEKYSDYYSDICELFTNTRIYGRKKCLKRIIEKNPDKKLYDTLLEVGSSELISGLFLEMAKLKSDLLLDDAKKLYNSKIDWVDKNYARGIKRCAKLYINIFDENKKDERIKWINTTLPEIDINLLYKHNEKIESDNLEGIDYLSFCRENVFDSHYYGYDENGKWKGIKIKKRYEPNNYTDGLNFDYIKFKNTMQESELYELEEVTGKIAYYLDSPRLVYYFKGSGNNSRLKYFQRYARRILDSYASNNPDKFIKAMKILFTSYTKKDYLCNFAGNFQYNYFIKHYLYNKFEEQSDYWYDSSEDQLLKAEGRYEFKPEIWDSHLEDVIDIAVDSKINVISKACYYILSSEKNKDYILNVDIEKLIKLAECEYENLSKLTIKILEEKLKNIDYFDLDLMFKLINCKNSNIHKISLDYYNRTNGRLNVSQLADLLLLDNFNQWTDLFMNIFSSIDENGYIEFIKQLLNSTGEIKKRNIEFNQEIKDFLLSTINKINNISYEQKVDILSFVTDVLFNNEEITEFFAGFIEDLIFNLDYEELKNIVKETSINNSGKVISAKNKRIITILEAMQKDIIPTDSEIISILEESSSRIVKILIDIINANKDKLIDRFSTIIIMFESKIAALNNIAKSIFESMEGTPKEILHSMIIDSPVERVYLYALEMIEQMYFMPFSDRVPESFIIQMLEHGAPEVRAYISDKIENIFNNLNDSNKEIFMYYMKTLLLIPNKLSKSKKDIYNVIPNFVSIHKDKLSEVEEILLNVGGSNIILDSERALITLAKIKKEVM